MSRKIEFSCTVDFEIEPDDYLSIAQMTWVGKGAWEEALRALRREGAKITFHNLSTDAKVKIDDGDGE